MTSFTFDTYAAGMLVLRVTAGILFFFQGYDKIFRVGIRQVIETINEPLKRAPFPNGWLSPMIVLSSFIEMVGGVLLAIGILGDLPLALLAADLVAVAFVFSATNAMWDMQFYFPRYSIITVLFFLPSKADHFRLDVLF